jgi:predicted 3-demethylubiquinone-9 3-methyltransferase (glyoxalase superfamily)
MIVKGSRDRPGAFRFPWEYARTRMLESLVGGSAVGFPPRAQALKFGPNTKVTMSRIIPNLWYTDEAEEAAAFYASVLPNSKVDSVTALPAESPGGPAGSVKVVEFTLLGQPFMAISAGALDPFNHAVSFMVECADQAEIDQLWVALSDGGKVEKCGWLRDRYGLCWQIVPKVLGEMMKDPDRTRAKRVAEAMLQMVKLDIAGLERAYEGP